MSHWRPELHEAIEEAASYPGEDEDEVHLNANTIVLAIALLKLADAVRDGADAIVDSIKPR